MTRIFSFHHNKSTGVGGVESLINSFHQISRSCDFKYIELFNNISGTEIGSEKEFIQYIQLYENKKANRNLWDKILERYNLWLYFKKSKMNKSDILFIFSPEELLFFPLSSLKTMNVVLVQTNRFSEYFARLGGIVMKYRSKYIDLMTVYTLADKERLINLYPNMKDKIKIIPRGCKIETALTPKLSSKKLVTITRIDERQKNLSSMIEIINLLPEGYTLDIYGDGNFEEVSKLKEKIGNNPRIRFLGVTIDVTKTLKNYSLFLMTSKFEGFGQTLIEARSQGLPIVAFDTFDALSSIIEDGVNGFKVSPFEINEYKDKIIEIIEGGKYNNYSLNSLKKAEETEYDKIFSSWKESISNMSIRGV